jgi:hypothetical protein
MVLSSHVAFNGSVVVVSNNGSGGGGSGWLTSHISRAEHSACSSASSNSAANSSETLEIFNGPGDSGNSSETVESSILNRRPYYHRRAAHTIFFLQTL